MKTDKVLEGIAQLIVKSIEFQNSFENRRLILSSLANFEPSEAFYRINASHSGFIVFPELASFLE